MDACSTGSASARRLRSFSTAALLLGGVLLLSGCVQSSLPEARRNAVEAAREEAVAQRGTLARALSEERDAAALARRWERAPSVFASMVDGPRVSLDMVVVGTGGHGDGVGRESTEVRACLRYTGTAGSRKVTIKDVPCPAAAHRPGAPLDTALLFS